MQGQDVQDHKLDLAWAKRRTGRLPFRGRYPPRGGYRGGFRGGYDRGGYDRGGYRGRGGYGSRGRYHSPYQRGCNLFINVAHFDRQGPPQREYIQEQRPDEQYTPQ